MLLVALAVSFTSSADLANVTFAPSGGLAKVMTAEPATIAALRAGSTASLTLSFKAPAEGGQCRGGAPQAQRRGGASGPWRHHSARSAL